MESVAIMPNMRQVGINPADVEAASLPAFIHTIRAHTELGAPEPPHSSLRHEIGSGEGNESEEDPRVVRNRQRWERKRRLVLAQHRQAKMCRRKLHAMTESNTYRGKNGEQCRACRNAARRAA